MYTTNKPLFEGALRESLGNVVLMLVITLNAADVSI